VNLRSLQRNFDALAAEDPLWTVLSDNAKKGGAWDEEEFYQTGEDEIDWLERMLAERGISFTGKRAIDFGCGVGRLTFPLSKRFQETIGIDIAQAMIVYAQRKSEGNDRTFFRQSNDPEIQLVNTNSIDLVYSNIVLQHIAPRYAKRYLASFHRILKPAGYLLFQLPSHLNRECPDNQKPLRMLRKRLHYLSKRLRQRISPESSEPYFEMNALPRKKLIRFMERRLGFEHGFDFEYEAAGPSWKSYFYAFRKRP